MICTDCRNQVHDRCPGGTWCFCQHRTDAQVIERSEKAEEEEETDP